MPENERRRDDGEIRERMARIEAGAEATGRTLVRMDGEISLMRQRIHELSNGMQIVVSGLENADETRTEMVRKIDDLGEKIEPIAAMQSDIKEIVQTAKTTRGVWIVLVKLGAVISAIMTALGAIAGGIWWLWGHVALK